MEREGKSLSKGCADGEFQRIVRHYENGWCPKGMDKGVIWSEEGSR